MNHSYSTSTNICAIILLLLPTLLIASPVDLFEGSACKLHTGELGVCKKAHKCKWLKQGIQSHRFQFSDIIRCTFSQGDEVVCCGDEHPKHPIPDELSPCNLGYIFEHIDCSGSESGPIEIAVTPEKPITTQSKISGTRISEACSRYTAISTVYFPSSIINGFAVGLSEFPHMVALGYPREDNSNAFDFDCGGTLISEQWVVTAAHCIKERRQPTVVRMGKIYLHNDEDGVEAVDRPISRIVRHPQYSLFFKKNDIALIQFSGSVDFDSNLRPACIRTDPSDVPVSQELIIAGWGSIEAGRTNRSELLLKTNVTSVPLSSCNETLTEYNRDKNWPSLRALSESQMCAVDLQRRSDACQGDSGGPIFTYDVSGVSTIAGIVSFGISCGTSLPSVYTRISSYVDWIENIVWP